MARNIYKNRYKSEQNESEYEEDEVSAKDT